MTLRAGMLALACLVLATVGCARGASAPASPERASQDASAPPAAAVANPAPAQADIAPAPASNSPVEIPPATPVAMAGTDRAPLLACHTDSDCAVKDVGSCCGYRPACVNAQAPTFPDEVKARCAAEGRVGACGFAAIEGCQCRDGQCAAAAAGIGPAAPEPLR